MKTQGPLKEPGFCPLTVALGRKRRQTLEFNWPAGSDQLQRFADLGFDHHFGMVWIGVVVSPLLLAPFRVGVEGHVLLVLDPEAVVLQFRSGCLRTLSGSRTTPLPSAFGLSLFSIRYSPEVCLNQGLPSCCKSRSNY